MKVEVIMPAAGSGERLRHSLPKPFVPILDEPLFIHALRVFEKSSLIDSVILVIQEELLAEYQRHINFHCLNKVKTMVQGGAERSISVSRGLDCVDGDTDIVLVHDAARPLLTVDMIQQVVDAAAKIGAATVGVPVKPTLKKVNDQGMVEETLDRSTIWEIQTPQGFQRDILIRAHEGNKEGTDDASLVERLGLPVQVVMGSYSNIKVTTEEDIGVATHFLEVRDEKN